MDDGILKIFEGMPIKSIEVGRINYEPKELIIEIGDRATLTVSICEDNNLDFDLKVK